MTLESCDTLL